MASIHTPTVTSSLLKYLKLQSMIGGEYPQKMELKENRDNYLNGQRIVYLSFRAAYKSATTSLERA